MSLYDKLTQNPNSTSLKAPWSGTTSTWQYHLKNTTKQSEMHANFNGDAGKGYSLSGDPNQGQLPINKYFRSSLNKTLSIPSPSTIDTNSGVTTTYTTHYPGNGQLGAGRYSQNAPENQSPGGL